MVELRDAACQQLLQCFAQDGVFTQAARDIFAGLQPHHDDSGTSAPPDEHNCIDPVVAVETKLLLCNTIMSEIVRTCSYTCVEQGLLIDRCFALARDSIADMAFDHDRRYSDKLNSVLEESRGLRRRIVELEQSCEAQDLTIFELNQCIGNFERSMKTLKNWLETSRKEEAAAQHLLEIAKNNLQQERAAAVQLRTAANIMTTTQIEVRQKMEDALKDVVRLTDEVSTLQSVQSKSGMQKLASEAGLGGLRVTDKLKNALKALAVARNDLMKVNQEKQGIGQELKNLTTERDMLREKLSNLSPKLESLFARERDLMSELESESNARKRLAAAADEQKIVILDLQKALSQLQFKLNLQQKTRAKQSDGEDDLLASTAQLLSRTRMAADKSAALFSDLSSSMPVNPNDKCVATDAQVGSGKTDQASLFENLLDTAKAEVSLSRGRLMIAEKEIEAHLALIEQQRAYIHKLEHAPPPPGPDTYDVPCQTHPVFVYLDDIAASFKTERESLSQQLADAISAAETARSEAEGLRSDALHLAERYDLECKSVDGLRNERAAACAAILSAIQICQDNSEDSEGKNNKKGKDKGKDKEKEKEKDKGKSKDKAAVSSKDDKDSKDKKSNKTIGNASDCKANHCISGCVSAHIAASAQSTIVRSDTNENILVCAKQLAEFLELAAQDAVSSAQRALESAESDGAAAKKEILTLQERCTKAEESLNKLKTEKDSKAKAAEVKAAEERAKKEAEAAAAAVAAQFAAAAAAEAAAAAAAAAAAKAAAAVVHAAVQTDSSEGAGALIARMFEGKLTLANLTVQLQNIKSKGLFKDKNDSAPSKLELQLSQQVKRLSNELSDMHCKLAVIVPDYVPPTQEQLEQYTLSDAAAASAVASRSKEPALQLPAPVTSSSSGTQTSRASTSHGRPTTSDTASEFSFANEARRLKHEDKYVYRLLCCSITLYRD
jgi:hypothetical protein